MAKNNLYLTIKLKKFYVFKYKINIYRLDANFNHQ